MDVQSGVTVPPVSKLEHAIAHYDALIKDADPRCQGLIKSLERLKLLAETANNIILEGKDVSSSTLDNWMENKEIARAVGDDVCRLRNYLLSLEEYTGKQYFIRFTPEA